MRSLKKDLQALNSISRRYVESGIEKWLLEISDKGPKKWQIKQLSS